MTKFKTCFKCGTRKPTGDFYKHPRTADGRLGSCKECHRAGVRENRLRNREHYRLFDQRRATQPERVARGKAYKQTEAGKSAMSRGRLASEARYPNARRATVAVGNALRDGRLTKEPCEVCGKLTVQAHHDDYDKPLTVRWLCVRHHREWHVSNGPGLNREQSAVAVEKDAAA